MFGILLPTLKFKGFDTSLIDGLFIDYGVNGKSFCIALAMEFFGDGYREF